MNLKIYFFILIFLMPLIATAQKGGEFEEKIIWTSISAGNDSTYLPFENASLYSDSYSPIWIYHVIEGEPGHFINAEIEILSSSPARNYFLEEWVPEIPTNLSLNVDNFGKREPMAKLRFSPYYSENGTLYKIENYKIKYQLISGTLDGGSRGDFEYKNNSVLRDGEIYKLAISKNGVYKIDAAYISSELDLNPSNINPNHIKIYTNGGGSNPINFEDMVFDDLEQIPGFFSGNGNNSFEDDEFILFYSRNQNDWLYKENPDEEKSLYSEKINIYDEKGYVFLKIDNTPAVRVNENNITSAPDVVNDDIDEVIHYEVDNENILNFRDLAHGGGQQWFGDYFREQRTRDYSSTLNFRNPIVSGQVKFLLQFAARSPVSTYLKVTANGVNFSEPVTNIPMSSTADVSYQTIVINSAFPASSNNIDFELEYGPTGATSFGWLDYISAQARVKNEFRGNSYIIRDHTAANYITLRYNLYNAPDDVIVWDITDPINVSSLRVENLGNSKYYQTNGGTRKEFVAFSLLEDFPKPEFVEKVENQNLHATNSADLLIVYAKNHESEAKRLAAHRSQHDGLEVLVVEDLKVYNEFGGGIKDPMAIRNFARMIFERDPQFRFLLLFGDGTFDHRDIYNQGLDLDNYIPTYQSVGSNAKLYTYPSDDFFAILEEDRSSNLQGFLNIGVGRIPVSDNNQAVAVVNKIINYDKKTDNLGDWKNRIVFLGDDEDSSKHIKDSDLLAQFVDSTYSEFNINKLYADAFPQVSTPGGQRYPEVNRAISEELFKGIMLLNYFGHGGYKSMAQEQIMTIVDVQNWNNADKLPIFITATCTFAPYDDSFIQSIGEEIFLKENGGAIALFTTTRDVFANFNYNLSRSVFKFIFARENGKPLEFGTILRLGKNAAGTSIENTRKFALLGDPSQKIALPTNYINITSVNEREVDGSSPTALDTLKALSKVTVTGTIVDFTGNQLSSYNGILTPTVYDKAKIRQNLGQDPGSSVINFKLQNNILFKGNVTVKNGQFEFSFIVPKDIDYEIGPGKISLYASNGKSGEEATGDFRKVDIGGSSNEINDDTPPIVNVYMNTESFVSGGLTDRNPKIIAKMNDDTGINITGSSIGHDITATLNSDNKNSYILNDFFESSLDDYTSGEVTYPLFGLEPGTYTLRVRAWDIANNPGEGVTEFIVASNEDAALERVLNYPNPFTDNTYFQFEHNIPSGYPLDIKISIYTISGKIIKTIQYSGMSSGSIITDIQWNGRDDFQQKLAAGVYIYRVALSSAAGTANLSGESNFEKLVILN